MRAAILPRFGPPDVLVVGDVADPVPAAGQVLVKVELASVTFVETQIRAGRPPHSSMLPALPAILGNGVGGVVTAIGPDVAAELLGQRVVTRLNGTGGYAEQAVADAATAVPVPAGMALRDVVALLADGRTALLQVRQASPVAGETVLVDAAAGGVGTLLVQLARAAGARVVAVAGGARKLELARELGAEVAIDYHERDWPQLVRDAVADVDVVFDGVGGEVGEAGFGLLRDGGRFCPFGMSSGRFATIDEQQARSRGIRVQRGGAPGGDDLTALTRSALTEAAAGRLRPVVGQAYPMADAAGAHTAIESRATIGKTLLTVP